MRDFQNMKQSQIGDDPLTKEIILFKKKREQADAIEKIFRNIKSNYQATDINKMKNVLDKKLIEKNPAVNKTHLNNYFAKLKADFSNKAFQAPEYTNGQIINNFETNELAPNSASPASVPYLEQSSAGNRVTQAGMQTPSRITQQEPRQGNQVHFAEPVTAHQPSQSHQPVQLGSHMGTSGILKTSPSTQGIIPGNQPQARISAEKTEVQISTRLNHPPNGPSLSHLRNISLGRDTIPSALKAIDSRNILLGTQSGSVKVIDLEASALSKQFKFPSRVTVVETVENNGRGKHYQMGVLVGLAKPDCAIVLLELGSDKPLNKFKGHTDEVTAIVTLPGGYFVSSSQDGAILLWHVDSGSPLSTLSAHTGRVNSLSTLNNGQILLSGGEDGLIKIFSVIQGHGGCGLQPQNSINEGFPVSLLSSFNGNSKFIVSCLRDGTVRIWNVESGECLNQIQGLKGDVQGLLKITSVSEQPDILLLAMTGQDDRLMAAGVDEKAFREINAVGGNSSARPLFLEKQKFTGQASQIFDAKATEGLIKFGLLERDQQSGNSVLSLWEMK